MLRLCLALVATAQLGRSAPAQPPAPGAQCIEHLCFGVFWGRQRFPGAGRLCQAGGGQLMTVRSTVAEAAIALLVRNRSDASLWIGLQLPAGQACSDPARPLRGFRWVTGDERTDYTRWGPGGRVCGSQCVTVAAPELTWEEKRCDSEADGFLCEYNYPGTCPKLSPGAGLAVTYTTPFGAQDSDLLVLPPQTTASAPALGVELVCQEHSSGGMRWSAAGPGAWHCQLENGGCEASCQWDDGTPHCTCPQGKRLDQDQRSCSSLCAGARCEQSCIPLSVNFTCMCHEGYELAEDGIRCRDIDDCKTKPDLCDQVCINTDGGFDCQCHPGYELLDGKCEDVIDCYEEKCHHQCVDVPGGYKCSCFSGYAPSPQDPNKCVLFCNQTECPADCDPHTQETCYCPDGFVLDHHNDSAKMCVDIDECEQSYCTQWCTNKPGSFTCHCSEGYSLHKEHLCIPEDEFSGGTDTYPTTAAPTPVPPKSESLHPGVLIGISIGILSTIMVLMAILYHLMKKYFPGHGAMDYKCSNRTEKEVVLQQVPPGCPSATQKL